MTKDFVSYRKDLQGLIARFRKSAPQTMAAFGQLHEESMKDGAISAKHKELLALAVGIASHCDGCIAFHTYEALSLGATKQEIDETIGVTIMMGGGPSLMYAAHAVDAMEQFAQSGLIAAPAK